MPKETARDATHELRRPTKLTLKRFTEIPDRSSADAIAEARPPTFISDRDRLFRHSLIYADVLAMGIAVFLSVVLLGQDGLRWAALLAIPVLIGTGKVIGLYDHDELRLRKTTLDEAPALFQLATLYTLLAWLFQSLFIHGYMGRLQVICLWGTLLFFSLIGRVAARALATRLTEPERCLLVGDAETMSLLARKFTERPSIHGAIVGRVSLDRRNANGRWIRNLEEQIVLTDAHRVIVAPRNTDGDTTLEVVRLVKAMGVKVSLLPRVLEVVGSAVVFDDLHGVNLLGVRRYGLTRSSFIVKRAFDIAGASLGLLAVAPLLIVVAIAIRLESRGPILFRQVRVGRDGKRFQMYKLRTMVHGADEMKHELLERNEAKGLFKIADDPRITRIGRILRKSSLDELPQLFNVIKGDMSLVGPRPLVVDEDLKVEGWHRRRLHLTPGMTGHWQILGSSRIPLEEMVKIDYLYVATWSFWGDLKILLRTVPYMLRADSM
jgi:exopolysaccharide biosynthesis polyprenyl glycosylphosphotransferase